MTPINPVPVHHTEGGHKFSNVFRKAGVDGEPGKLLARFFGDDHKAHAEEFCTFVKNANERFPILDDPAPKDVVPGNAWHGAPNEVDLPNARPVIDIDQLATDNEDEDDF